MLLLTLLPLAGWALPASNGVPVNVGGYTVTLDRQYVPVGSLSPTATVTGATGTVSFDGVVDKDFNTAVEPLTTAGYYYKVIVDQTSADNQTKIYVPFYVGDKIGFDFIYDKTTFDNSVKSGALKLYYEDAIANCTDNPTYWNGTPESYAQERDYWSVAASKNHGMYTKGVGFPWVAFKAPETGHFKPALSYTGTIGATNNSGDYVGENVLCATPWTASFGQAAGLKKYGLVSTNALYSLGQIYYDATTEQDVNESTFNKDKFTAFWIPETFDTDVADAAKTEKYSRIKVRAIPFEVPYGTEIGEDFIVTSKMIDIEDDPGDSKATEEILVNYKEGEKGLFTFEKITEGAWTAVTAEGYQYKLKSTGVKYVKPATTTTDATYYEITFVSDRAYCMIIPAVNTFKEGVDLPQTKADALTYNGELQDLLAKAGEATFGNVQYAVVPGDKVTVTVNSTNNTTTWEFAEGYTPTWGDNAKAEDVLWAEGITNFSDNTIDNVDGNVLSYYVFAKPAAGESWTEGAVKYAGAVKIVRATPTIEFDETATTIVDPTTNNNVPTNFFYKTGGDHNLHSALTVGYKLYAGTGDSKKEVSKYVNEIATQVQKPNGDNWVKVDLLADFKASKPGATADTYRVRSIFSGNSNLKRATSSLEKNREFTVAVPKVFVRGIAKKNPVAFAEDLTNNWDVEVVGEKWQGGDYGESLNKTNATWSLLRPNGQTLNPANDGNYPAGTWAINVTGVTVNVPEGSNQAEADHVVVVVAGDDLATLTIGRADIYAKVESYDTDETALIYGQNLPVKLTHVDGLTDENPDDNINAYAHFESIDRNWTFTATKIKDADGKPVTDATPKSITRNDVLDAGTYNVTYTGPYESPNSNGNKFNVVTESGTWKVLRKNLDNSDRQRAGYYVNYDAYYNYNANVNPSVVYNGKPQTPDAALARITYRYVTLKESKPAQEAAAAVEDNPNTFVNESRPAQEAKDAEVNDYTIQITNNTNAGKGIEFKLLGDGNFCGESPVLKFDINKKAIPVYPLDATWRLCENETNLYGIDWIRLFTEQDGLVPEDKDAYPIVTQKVTIGEEEKTVIVSNALAEQPGFSSLAVRRLTGPNAGVFTQGIQAYLPADATPATNYDFTPGKGKITINKGKIVLTVNNPVEAVYNGTAEPALPEGYYFFDVDRTESTLADVWYDNDNWKKFLQPTAAIKYTMKGGPAADATDKRWYAGRTGYTLEIATTEARKFSTTNFDIEIAPTVAGGEVAIATVNVVPADLEVTTKNQPLEGEGYAFDELDELFQTGIDQIYLTQKDGKDVTPLKQGDALTDLFGTKVYDNGNLIKVDNAVTYPKTTVTVGLNEKVIDVVPTAIAANYNYVNKVSKGDLKIKNATDLNLTSVMADVEVVSAVAEDAAAPVATQTVPGDWSKLLAHNGKPVQKITLKLKPASMEGKPAFSQWNEDEWHAMVLPFAVTVKELSKAFDFAYINVVDPIKTTENNVQFKVPNILDEIPANTPFCIKSSVPYKYKVEDNPTTPANEAQEADVLTFERTGKNFFQVDLTGIETTGENKWMVEGVDAGMGYTFAGTYAENFAIDKTKSNLRFINNKWYFIKSDSEKVYNMPPYTGFANLGTASATREVTFTFEEEDGSTTAIKAVDFFNGNKANAEGVYRVDGVKVQGATTQKGVYIQNGKKYVK